MSRQKRNKKVKSNKRVKYRKPIHINSGVVVFLFLFVYMLILIVSYFRKDHIAPYEVKLGSLAVNNTYKGLVLRDEHVVKSGYSGYINYYAREGEKIANGSMVYTVDSTGKLSQMVNDEAYDNNSLTDEDMKELKVDISSFASDFSPVNYKDTYNFKYNIQGTVLKLANYKILSNIDMLREENYTDSIDFGYSDSSGVLIYSTDGYEEVTPEMVTDEYMYPENYEKKQFHSNDLIAEGDNAYKVVTSEDWTIITEIDDEKALSLEKENGYVEVRFLKNNYTAWAAVEILRQNGKIYAKLTLNNSMITFATERFVDIEILDNAKEGLKIPQSAIVNRTFYLIPEVYLTHGGNTGDDGFMREKYLEDGSLSTEFVNATIYNNIDGELYVDETVFKIGDRIVMPESGEIYTISKQDSLIGVYNINKGYADFKQITILNENEDYAIVKSNSEYGLSVYDHIVLKGDSVNDNDFIYEMKKDIDNKEEETNNSE